MEAAAATDLPARPAPRLAGVTGFLRFFRMPLSGAEPLFTLLSHISQEGSAGRGCSSHLGCGLRRKRKKRRKPLSVHLDDPCPLFRQTAAPRPPSPGNNAMGFDTSSF